MSSTAESVEVTTDTDYLKKLDDIRSELPESTRTKDPRILDYLYELTFSTGKVDDDNLQDVLQQFGKEGVRNLLFALPEFKAAADKVAYSEDLLTREVTLLEGIARCRLCGSNNTSFTTRHMHSSDEAPTMMLYCGSCHHRTNQTGE